MNKSKILLLKADLLKEQQFVTNVFSVLSVPERMKDLNDEQVDTYVYVNQKHEENLKGDKSQISQKRAQSIVELREKLEKVKKDNNYSIKNKLIKKSLTSKLNRKTKKNGKNQMKKKVAEFLSSEVKEEKIKKENEKLNVTKAKPVFNVDGKLVFSKFDFTSIGQNREKKSKTEKDPKKILDNLKKQEETVHQLQESGEAEKAVELKNKIAWKNVLAKAEGQKVKDDPLLLKKSIKKKEQIKKQSTKQWTERTKGVEEKMQQRQKKRQENLSNKKKEKQAKKIKVSSKRGRVVIK